MIKRPRLTALIAALLFGGHVLALQLTRVALTGDATTTVQPGSRTSVGFKSLTEMTASDGYKGEDGGLYGDGLIWERNDLAEDGVHPSESGRRKVAEMLLNFFKTDSLAATWFVKKR